MILILLVSQISSSSQRDLRLGRSPREFRLFLYLAMILKDTNFLLRLPKYNPIISRWNESFSALNLTALWLTISLQFFSSILAAKILRSRQDLSKNLNKILRSHRDLRQESRRVFGCRDLGSRQSCRPKTCRDSRRDLGQNFVVVGP